MTSGDLVHWLGLIAMVSSLLLFGAYRRPALYLQCRDGFTLSIHALALGFVFGIGVIIGRYGFEGGLIKPMWMALHLTMIIVLYMGALSYHGMLCAIAETVSRGTEQIARNR